MFVYLFVPSMDDVFLDEWKEDWEWVCRLYMEQGCFQSKDDIPCEWRPFKGNMTGFEAHIVQWISFLFFTGLLHYK